MSVPDVAALPDPAALESAASSFGTLGHQVVDAAGAIQASWQGLAAADVYGTPESAQVFRAPDRVVAIADLVKTSAASAKSALDTYATTVSGLIARRGALLDDQAALTKLDPETTEDYDHQESSLAGRISSFNQDLEQADSECAAALAALSSYDPSLVSRVLGVASGNPAGSVMGVGEAVLERYRRLLVPGANASAVDLATDLAKTELKSGGVEMAYDAAKGLYLPTNAINAAKGLPPITTEGWKSHAQLIWDAEASKGAIPMAAKVGGRALGAAGVVLTIGSQYDEQYQADKQAHPEWSDSQRAESATENAVVVGGLSAAGGLAGAAGGAELGAALGSIFPGPGTVIGGVVGGIAGGIIGSGIGEAVGHAVKDSVVDAAHGIGDGATKVWKGLFG